MIKKLEIRKFKQLVEFNTDLDWLTVLVGANNSGKSSVLQAIHFFVSIAQSRQLIDGWSIQDLEDEKKYSGTIAPQQIIYTPAHDMMRIANGGRITQSDEGCIYVSFKLRGQHEGYMKVKRGKNKNIFLEMKGKEVLKNLEKIDDPFSVFVPGLAGLARTETYIAKGNLLRSLARGDSNLILRNVLYSLHQEVDKWNKFSGDLEDIFPGVVLDINFSHEFDECIEVSVIKDKMELPLDYAGTGLLQTIQILAYINLFEPTVTLLDEPDSHLHPNNQRNLAKKLIEFSSTKRTQVILATHSRHMLDAFGSMPKYIWVRNGASQEIATHLDLLMDLGALDNAEGLLAGGIQYVILTEDEDKRLIKLLVSEYRDLNQVQIWSYKGCTNRATAEALSKFIKEVSKTTEVIIHRDSDYLTDDFMAYLKDNYGKQGMKMFFTNGVNIESYFVDPSHLKKINRGHASEVMEAYESAFIEHDAQLRVKARKGRLAARELMYKEGFETFSKADISPWAEGLDISDTRWINGKEMLPMISKKFRELAGKDLKYAEKSGFLKDDNLKRLLKITRNKK